MSKKFLTSLIASALVLVLVLSTCLMVPASATDVNGSFRVDGESFPTLSAAVAKVADGGTIYLTGNYTAPTGTENVTTTKTYTLDGGGYTITAGGGGRSYNFNGGTCTIKNIRYVQTTTAQFFNINDNGTVILGEGAEFTHQKGTGDTGLFVVNGTPSELVLGTGCVVTNQGAPNASNFGGHINLNIMHAKLTVQPGAKLVTQGVKVTAPTSWGGTESNGLAKSVTSVGEIELQTGDFVTSADEIAGRSATEMRELKLTLNYECDDYGAVFDRLGFSVRTNESEKIAFSSLSSAVWYSPDGAALEVVKDFSSTGTTSKMAAACAQQKTLTLNGNQHTVTGIGGKPVLTVYQNVNLTVTNLKMESKEGTAPKMTTQLTGGALTLGQGAEIRNYGSAAGGNSDRNGVRIEANGSALTLLEGGAINVKGTAIVSEGVKSLVEVRGGSITTATRLYVTSGDANNQPVFNLYSGLLMSTHSSEYFFNKYGADFTLNIYGGTISFQSQKFYLANAVKDSTGLHFMGGTIKCANKVIMAAPDITNDDVRLRLPEAATRKNSGLAFGTQVDFNGMSAESTNYIKVDTGTLIIPKAYLADLNEFTMESLVASGKAFINVVNEGWYNAETVEQDGYYEFYGSIVNLRDSNLDCEFVSIGYVRISVTTAGADAFGIKAGTSFTFYGQQQSGTVSVLAQGAAGGNAAQNEVLNAFRGSEN